MLGLIENILCFFSDSFSSVFDAPEFKEGVSYTKLEDKVKCRPKEGVQVSFILKFGMRVPENKIIQDLKNP